MEDNVELTVGQRVRKGSEAGIPEDNARESEQKNDGDNFGREVRGGGGGGEGGGGGRGVEGGEDGAEEEGQGNRMARSFMRQVYITC